MLILTRKLGESIKIGDLITITFLEIRGKQVRIGIDAPPNVIIHRQEVYEAIREENVRAVEFLAEDSGDGQNTWNNIEDIVGKSIKKEVPK